MDGRALYSVRWPRFLTAVRCIRFVTAASQPHTAHDVTSMTLCVMWPLVPFPLVALELYFEVSTGTVYLQPAPRPQTHLSISCTE